MKFEFITRVRKSGKSTVMTLPPVLVDNLKIADKQQITITVEGGDGFICSVAKNEPVI
jgi:antitoxin component of MazEF toxin-antitoxin module